MNKIKEFIDDCKDYYRHKYYDIRSFIAYRTYKKFHILKMKYLKPGWCDRDEIMLHAMFQALCDFIEKEHPDEIVDWESDLTHKNAREEMHILYDWWKYRNEVRPEEEKVFYERNNMEEIVDYNDIGGSLKLNFKKNIDEWISFEDKCLKEDEEMALRLLKIRRFLWT